MKNRFYLPVALGALALTAASSPAALVYSGFQNIAITNSFDSVYVDVDQFGNSPTQASGWDIDAFFGGEAFGNSANFQPVRQTVAVDSAILRLDLGEVIDGSRNYYHAEAGSSTHIGTAPGQFASGVTGYLGFRFIANNAAGPYFGWMRVNLSNTGEIGKILDWTYENSGAAITVGAIPEPTSFALAGLGCAMLLLRRRKS